MARASLLKFPGMLSIEQLVMVARAQEERIARLERVVAALLRDAEEPPAPALTATADLVAHHEACAARKAPSRAREIENRTRWVAAMDAFIAGDGGALKRFTDAGGWTPPAEYR